MKLGSFLLGVLGLIVFLGLLVKPAWNVSINVWLLHFSFNILSPIYILAWTPFTLPYIGIKISLAIILAIISVILVLIGLL